MKTLITNTVAAGLLFGFSASTVAQVEDAQDEPDRARQLQQQAELDLIELFQDLELAEPGVQDPRERLLQERQRLEEIQQRIIELRLGQQRERGLVQQRQAAEPIQLDAKAYVNPFAERSRDEVLAALGHEDFAVRQSAEAFLLTDDKLNQTAIKELIKQADSPEQHQRLLRVAEHHVLRQMRERDFGQNAQREQAPNDIPLIQQPRPASIGYSYEPVMAHENPHMPIPGVRVIATMPGFPGYAHLRQGDIIVQIAGQGLNQNHQHHDITNWVRWRIAAHMAGDPMTLTILRDGDLLKVELICAEGLALDHMYTTDAFETAARKAPYKQAWEQARDELIAELPKPKKLTPVAIDAE